MGGGEHMQDAIRKTIRVLIAERGLKKKDVAAKIDVSSTSFSNKLHGKSNFTLNEIVALSELLGFSVDEALRIKDCKQEGMA
jgi:antitoxin component HigA of HigAB toxin-antitoxin module